MIYITNDQKYINGERTEKPIKLNIIRTQYHHLDVGCDYNSNLTENHMIFLVTSGSICINNENVAHGSIICIPRFSKLKFTTIQFVNLIEITFDYSESITLFNNKIRIIKSQSEEQESIKKIYANSFFNNSLIGVGEGLLLNLLNTLNNLCDSSSCELELYEKTREWIEQNSTFAINAENTARAMHCTVAHLNRTVKKHSGRCLSSIITEKRIIEIKRLIETSNFSTEDIALKLNFNSPELLRKFFKYHTGISIKMYKANLKTETPIIKR